MMEISSWNVLIIFRAYKRYENGESEKMDEIIAEKILEKVIDLHQLR